MKPFVNRLWVLLLAAAPGLARADLTFTSSPTGADCVLADVNHPCVILVEHEAEPAVRRAAEDLAADFVRVTGRRPIVTDHVSPGAPPRIIIGTLGRHGLLDRLAAAGKLATNGISSEWESYGLQVVTNPWPNLKRALVIAGSDRRGTIYGIYTLSEKIGVSPWYWWADVPVKPEKTVALRGDRLKQGPPAVKYRGIFINDEDWGLNPWAAKTFDPQFGNIGPRTYAKVFELMLRLRLNYLWPAMHKCSTPFGSVQENAALADRYGIVAGSSHCEPMLYNNVHWNERTQGRWNYALNRDAIYNVWKATAKARGQYEAVWTLGIRGIHDSPMERPPNDLPGKIKLMTEVLHDQRQLLNQYVTTNWGPVAQCFVPYKEVLSIYDAGLKVAPDVTLIWTDDNFGYLRRLSDPAERSRPGGAGVYWHMSYYGRPHSYTWINTTAPAFLWEELHKAWDNGARRIWMLNVGDIKPGEIGIDYFSRLAWDLDGFPAGGQREFLRDFATRNFSPALAAPLTDLLMEYYRLGTIRKPELMDREWALALSPGRAQQLERNYQDLLAREEALSTVIPADARDAYTEMIGFPARVLAETGLIFMADRQTQLGVDTAANQKKMASLREDLEMQVNDFNTRLAGGKWNHIMPGLVTGKNLMAWNSQVRWPWGEATNRPALRREPAIERVWHDAATADRQTACGLARWTVIEGLGPSGRAMALEPASLDSSWKVDDAHAPSLAYDFQCQAGDAEAWIDFLPTFRFCPGMKLRVAVSVDGGPPQVVEVPGSSGVENENGPIRRTAVQDNYVRASIPLPHLAAGRHILVIRAVDPGAVIDRVSLP